MRRTCCKRLKARSTRCDTPCGRHRPAAHTESGRHFQVKTVEIKILLWLLVSILVAISALGFAGRADLQPTLSGETLMSRTHSAAPLPAERTDEPLQAAHRPSAVETPPPGLGGGPPRKCPLSRVAIVRASDSGP